MAPELFATIEAQELQDLAKFIREFQLAATPPLSDNQLFKRFAGIGSTTTYKRILDGNLKELNLEKQLANYRSVKALIEMVGIQRREDEDLLDLNGPLQLRRAWLETRARHSIARVIIVQGDTGTGKTSTGQALVEKYGGADSFLQIEARQAWGDRPKGMLHAILRVSGKRELPQDTTTSELDVITLLKTARKGLVIDEAHHLGPRCLNTLKTLVNSTPGEFLLLAMGTLWGRLERAAYEEVKQLTGNRLSERIKLSLNAPDVEKIVRDRLSWEPAADLATAVEQVMEVAPLHGNLGFLRAVCDRLRDDHGETPITTELFISAITAERRKK